MTAPSTFKFALACGASGTYVDVTSDVLFEEGPIPFTDGRTSQFDGFGPGVFSFTLANGTGKYTPDNAASTLAVPVAEGMGVVMQLDALLISGTIRNISLIFPPKERATEARVRITCDDMLGNAARHTMGNLSSDLIRSTSPLLWWPLDDSANAGVAREAVTGTQTLIVDTGGAAAPTSTLTFGATTSTIPDVESTVALNPSTGTSSPQLGRTFSESFAYGTGTVGSWGFWLQLPGGTGFALSSSIVGVGGVRTILDFTVNSSSMIPGIIATPSGTNVFGPVLSGAPHWIALTSTTAYVGGFWQVAWTLSIDGVSIGTSTATSGISATTLPDSGRTPRNLSFNTTGTTSQAGYVAHLIHGLTLPDPTPLLVPTEANAFRMIAATVPEITLDTLPTDLDTAPMESTELSGSTLDAMNALIRAEQGYLWTETTGTLLSPVPKIKVAARNRERAIDYTFDVSEILDPIPLIRSLTDTVSSFTVNGPIASATYDDPSLFPLVGSASSSESSPLRDYVDLYTYASDRVARGAVVGVTVQSITIDATSPNISRWAALTAIRQGFLLRITGLPLTQLGYSTWDGFVVGRQIDSTQDSATDEPKTFFTFHLRAAPRHTFTLDADVLAAGGNLSVTSNINNSTTTIPITSSDATTITTTGGDFPLKFRIENEVVTASGFSGGNLTVTRGQTDPITGLATTAVAHTAGVLVEVADPAYLDY